MLAAVFVAPAAALAQSAGAIDESYFAKRLHPVLHAAQCERCHTSSGVASETQLAFPKPDAGPVQITAFGLSLKEVIDRQKPEQSLLLVKPTARVKHTGGQRIKPGSDEEKVLLDWVKYLAGLSDEHVRRAEEKVAAAKQGRLAPLAVRRLTHSQYDRTVRDLLGDQIQPAASFPKEDFVSGFKNQVEGQGVSPLLAEAYGKAAERLAAAAFRGGDHRGLIPGTPASVTDAELAERFVREFGLKAFRRPLSESEIEQYRELHLREAGRKQDFLAGATIVVEAMLQSPNFLFRIERGGEHAQYDTASRLSYFLWDTMPDSELFAAAAQGRLGTRDEIEATARRMLADERAKASFEEFLAQWLRFDTLLGATRDRRRFREFTAETAAAMAEETRRLFNHLVWSDQNFLEFFTADYSFVSSELARLYELPPPAEEFARVQYPEGSGRSGVLGHGSFLVATSKPAETSPTARGLFIRNHFLGHEVPPPPPGVDTTLPAITENTPQTNRQRLEVHLNSEACASCHRLIDPIGMAFEQYNAIGVFSEKLVLQFGSRRGGDRERQPAAVELALDTTGHIQGIENSQFSTPRELGKLLADSPACHKNIVKQLFRYAMGREETPADQPILDELLVKFRDSGFRFRELVVALVTSDLFNP
jgi:hypothetical protein